MMAKRLCLKQISFLLLSHILMFQSGTASAFVQCGKASWYALTSITASGQRANPNKLTAAHRTLPFGTKVRVTNRRNGRHVVVRINDRGPFVRGRVIDVTKRAAAKLGFVGAGWTRVVVTPAGSSPPKNACK